MRCCSLRFNKAFLTIGLFAVLFITSNQLPAAPGQAPDQTGSSEESLYAGLKCLETRDDEGEIRTTAHTRPARDRYESRGLTEIVDLVFVIDGSGSIDPNTFELQKQGVKNCLCGPEAFIPADGTYAVAVIQFTSSEFLEIPLSVIDSPSTADALCTDIEDIYQISGGTTLRPALDEAVVVFESGDGYVRQLIVSTDAGVGDVDESLEGCGILRTMNHPVQICTVLVGYACDPPPQAEAEFLACCANTEDSPTYTPSQPAGMFSCVESVEDVSTYTLLCHECLMKMDCNFNGVPDVCDVSCDYGGCANHPLGCGGSEDYNENGVPDECEDCNANGVPDGCDIDCGVGDCASHPTGCGVSGDCNSNGIPDECDIAEGVSNDCNTNGIPDECDIADETSEDCNSNGVPDECDLAGGFSEDCNSNGVPDECDLAGGVSADCNSNGVPDECDLAGGVSADCNSNGVPDECDIAGGFSEDCNSNGVPDECDIAGGVSADYDQNTVPDECEDCNDNGAPDACDISCETGDCASHPAGCGGSEDLDGDGRPDECIYLYVDDDAPHDPGPGSPYLSDPLEQGSAAHPFDAIQEALDYASSAGGTYEAIYVLDGTYVGEGNKNLDFAGLAIRLKSENGPECCVIDCENDGRGFYFHSGENLDSVVAGFTIRNGQVTWGSPGACRGGGIHCDGSSPTIVDCTISDCVVDNGHCGGGGGGIYCDDGSSPIISSCIIEGCHADTGGDGGAISCRDDSNPTIINCMINGNSAVGNGHCPGGGDASYGGALYCFSSSPTLINCTISGNQTTQDNYSHIVDYSYYASHQVSPSFSNCILWNEGFDEFFPLGPNDIPPSVNFSDVQGGWPGEGNIDGNPLFTRMPDDGGDGWGDDPNTPGVDEGANDDYGDLRLLAGSPCIDAADNAAVPSDLVDLDGDGDVVEPMPVDLDRICRFVDDPDSDNGGSGSPEYPWPYIVDMGAYEYRREGDVDCDGDVDLSDLAALLGGYNCCVCDPCYEENRSADFNHDGCINLSDLATLLGNYGAAYP